MLTVAHIASLSSGATCELLMLEADENIAPDVPLLLPAMLNHITVTCSLLFLCGVQGCKETGQVQTNGLKHIYNPTTCLAA